MRFILTLSALMLLCASAATGAGMFESVDIRMPSHALSEPAGLVALGMAFVLLAGQVRRRKVS